MRGAIYFQRDLLSTRNWKVAVWSCLERARPPWPCSHKCIYVYIYIYCIYTFIDIRTPMYLYTVLFLYRCIDTIYTYIPIYQIYIYIYIYIYIEEASFAICLESGCWLPDGNFFTVKAGCALIGILSRCRNVAPAQRHWFDSFVFSYIYIYIYI